MNERILVTGAAGGSQGATGRHLAGCLLERGLPVRAFVRRRDRRAAALAAAGAEVVVGDLLVAETVTAAFEGVKRAYFAYPVQAGLLEATTIFAAAARAAGAEIVVNVDHLNTSPDAPSPHTRRHWLGEQILDWAGIGATHLRCAVFYSNLRAVAADAIAGRGFPFALQAALTDRRRLYLPTGAGDGPIPFVAGEDVARVAATMLTNPAPYSGRAHYISAALRTPREIAVCLGVLVGRPVTYQPIPGSRFRAALARKLPDNPVAVEHLVALWADTLSDARSAGLDRVFREVGGPDRLSAALRELSGREPKTLEEDLWEHAAEFGATKTFEERRISK